MKQFFVYFSLASFILIPFAVFGQSDTSYANTLQRMFEANGSKASFSVIIDQTLKMYRDQATYMDTEIWDKVETELKKLSMNDLIDMLVPVYQKFFTQEDLEEMIAFYETPAGRKFAKHTPTLVQESMQVGQKWGMQIGEKIDSMMNERGYK